MTAMMMTAITTTIIMMTTQDKVENFDSNKDDTDDGARLEQKMQNKVTLLLGNNTAVCPFVKRLSYSCIIPG
jgi:hypothetical protein